MILTLLLSLLHCVLWELNSYERPHISVRHSTTDPPRLSVWTVIGVTSIHNCWHCGFRTTWRMCMRRRSPSSTPQSRSQACVLVALALPPPPLPTTLLMGTWITLQVGLWWYGDRGGGDTDIMVVMMTVRHLVLKRCEIVWGKLYWKFLWSHLKCFCWGRRADWWQRQWRGCRKWFWWSRWYSGVPIHDAIFLSFSKGINHPTFVLQSPLPTPTGNPVSNISNKGSKWPCLKDNLPGS